MSEPDNIMDSFMVRPGGAELAKTVHSISGSITAVFLFTPESMGSETAKRALVG